MVRTVSLAFVVVIALAQGCATAPAYQPPPLAADARLPMWEVKTADGKPAGHLFGTFHAMPEDELLDKRVFLALRQSDALVIEVSPDLDDARKKSVEEFTRERGMYPPSEPGLDERLDKQLYEQLAASASAAGVPSFAFARMRPWLAMVVVALGAAKNAGFDPENGAETQLLAGKAQVPVVELETVEEQLEALAATDDALFFTDIQAQSNEDPILSFRALYEAWRRGDAARIEELTFAPLGEHPELAPMYERMFFKRNDSMFAKVKARLDAGGHPFVAVGCGHMVGARGLIAQLTAAGYVVTQVGAQ